MTAAYILGGHEVKGGSVTMAYTCLYAFLKNQSWSHCRSCQNITNRRKVCFESIFTPLCYYKKKSLSMEHLTCSSLDNRTSVNQKGDHIQYQNKSLVNKRVIKTIVRDTFQAAKKAESKGDWKIAIKLLKQCLELDLTDAHSWVALAKIMMKQCFEVEEIRCLLNEAIEHCPESVHLLHTYAVFEYKAGFPDKARQLFRKGLSIEVNNGYIYQAWGLMEQRLGNMERARELFHECLQMEANLEVFIALGMLEAKCGNLQKSRDVFEMALKESNMFPPSLFQAKGKRKTNRNPKASLYRAWADVEESFGNVSLAMELLFKAVSECSVESETYFALAKLEYKRKNWLNARKWIQLAESTGSNVNVAIYSFWAVLEEKMNRLDIARELMEKASRIYVTDCSVIQTWATLEQRAGNVNKARELFRKSVDIRPNAPAFVAWALMEEKEANFETARSLFQRALLVDKLHSPTYNAYALYEARRGNLQMARTILEEGIRKVFSPCILHGYAQLELKYGNNISKAKQLLLEGTKCAYEDNSFVWHSLGHLELMEKNYDKAIRTFEQGISRYPQNSLLRLGLALCYVALVKDATLFPTSSHPHFVHLVRKNFEEAIKYDPFHAHAWQAWGTFELTQGKFEVARVLLTKGIRNCPSHVALWQASGLLEAQCGNMQKARAMFGQGSRLPLSESHVRLYHTWACCELRTGAVEQARKLLEEALRCDKTHGPVWNVYGMLEEHHGSINRARELFQEGIKQAPKHVHLYISYAMFEFRQGNEVKAKEIFYLAFDICPNSTQLKEAFAKLNEMLVSSKKKAASSNVEMENSVPRMTSRMNFSWLETDWILSELESSVLAIDTTRKF